LIAAWRPGIARSAGRRNDAMPCRWLQSPCWQSWRSWIVSHALYALLEPRTLDWAFKVRILIPATFLTIGLTCSFELMHRQGSVLTALVTTAAVIAIQMGYLIGVVVWSGTDRGVTANGCSSSMNRSRPLCSWRPGTTRDDCGECSIEP
jgi:hypothetical protein